MRGLPQQPWTRRAVLSAYALVLVVASGFIVWRVLKPTEVVTEAVDAYPAVAETSPGPAGALISAPLIVDGRIRVYADKRQIRSDDQPTFKYEKSPFWSFRRWPEQLVGVVHPQTAADGVPVIAGSWTDGELVALDGRKGTVLWRADAEVLGEGYDGRRTGSSVVWTPSGLLTGVATDQPVIATVGSGSVSVFGASDGRRLWTARTPICLEQAFTASGALIAPDSCIGPHALIRYDLATGARTEHPFRGFNDKLTVTPLGCRVGRSECGGVRMLQVPNRTAAWLIAPDGFIESPALASVTASLAGTTVVDSPLGETTNTRAIVGRDARTGVSLWTFSRNAAMRLIAATPDRVLLLGGDLVLTALDPATGRVVSSDSVALKQDRDPYAIGPVYTAGPYVAIERLKPKADATGTDDEYYYNARPILLAMS